MVLFFIFVVLFIYWCGMCGFVDFNKFNVGGLKFVLFFGNVLEIWKYDGLYCLYFDFFKKYGKVFIICLGGKLFLVVGDLELLK